MRGRWISNSPEEKQWQRSSFINSLASLNMKRRESVQIWHEGVRALPRRRSMQMANVKQRVKWPRKFLAKFSQQCSFYFYTQVTQQDVICYNCVKLQQKLNISYIHRNCLLGSEIKEVFSCLVCVSLLLLQILNYSWGEIPSSANLLWLLFAPFQSSYWLLSTIDTTTMGNMKRAAETPVENGWNR